MLLGDPADPADRRAEEHPDPSGVVRAVERRVRSRLRRRGDAEDDVAIEPPCLLRADDRRRVEALHLGGDPHRDTRSRRTRR